MDEKNGFIQTMQKSKYEMPGTISKFRQWLDKTGFNCPAVAKLTGINIATVYKAYYGGKLKKRVNATKLIKLSKGELSYDDLGITQ